MAKELGMSLEELLENALKHYINYLVFAKKRERAVLEGKFHTISPEELCVELGI